MSFSNLSDAGDFFLRAFLFVFVVVTLLAGLLASIGVGLSEGIMPLEMLFQKLLGKLNLGEFFP